MYADDNAMVECFNGRLRQECLNEHWFLTLGDSRSRVEAWRRFYNKERPAQHWHGNPLRNSPENTGSKRIPCDPKRAKSLTADGPDTGDGSDFGLEPPHAFDQST
ncbi:TPA: transposase [Stenotrophomonas maltophilia]|nr:transposase [Stenotrophomonas maltophilia]